MSTGTPRRPWVILAAVLVGTFTGAANNSAASVAVLDVMDEFDLDVPAAAWLMLGYDVLFVVILPVVGRLANRVGLRRVYLAGMALFTLASATVAVAPTYGWVVLGRILQGAGVAPVLPVVMLAIGRSFRPGARGHAMGVWASANGAALALGPVLGGLIVDAFGWRMIFWLDVPLGLVALVLAGATLPRDPSTGGRRVDIASVGLLCGGLAAVTVGLSTPSSWGRVTIVHAALMVVGAALLICFRIRTHRVPSHVEPLVDADVLRNANFAALTAIAGLQVMVFAMVVFVTPLALSLVFDLAIAVVGAVVFLLPMSIVVFSPATGYVADWIGVRRLATAGALLLVTSTALLAIGAATRTLPSAVVALVIGGIGVACIQAPVAASIVEQIADSHRGAAMGLFHSARGAGYMLGTSTAAGVVALVAPSGLNADLPANEGQQAVTNAYVVAAAVAVFLLALVWRAHPRRHDQHSPDPTIRPQRQISLSVKMSGRGGSQRRRVT